MSEEIYQPPDSNLEPESNGNSRNIQAQKPFLIKSWKGEIPLWKAIVLINIAGYILTIFTGIFGVAIAVQLASNLIAGIIYQQLLMLVFGVFCFVSVWRASSNCSTIVAGVLAKIWIILFAIYLIASALLSLVPLAQIVK